MPSNKFNKMYMLEVKANLSQKKKIVFLINNLVKTVKEIYPTAKIGLINMDRDE